MEAAELFLKKSKRRLYRKEYFQPHNVPRLNSHASSNSEPAENVLDDLLTSDHREISAYVTTYPIPIGAPVNVDGPIIKGTADPVLKLVRDKQQFKAMYEKVRQSKKIKGLTLEDIDNLSEMAENESHVNVDSSILAFARVCSLDPDPHFSCDYNYYYGGTATATELQGRMAVVHSTQDEPSSLRVVFPKFDREYNVDVMRVAHKMGESDIYQIDCFSNLILLRQKQSCGLFKFKIDKGSLKKVGVVTTPEVFVSSCLNTFKKGEFATVSPNSAIEIHDVRGKSKRTVEVEGVKDNWGHVHYRDENVLMFTDRDSVSLCDLREPGSESLQWEFGNQTDFCDNAFAAAKGKFLHYVSTKHYLLSLDIRKGFHQRWSHGLSNAPCLLEVVSNDTQYDALLIGCQSSGGVVYVQSSPAGDFTSDILCPPIRLPSLRETLHLARTKKCLLSPVISSRFSLSLAGLTSFKHSGKTHIFRCSSVGDLFTQSISPGSQSETMVEPLLASDLQRFSCWESQCLKQFHSTNHSFKATRVVSLRKLAHLFEDKCELSDEPSTSQINYDAAQPWRRSKKRLMSYKDVLAPKILAHWDIEDDDEWCDLDETVREESSSDESSDEQDVDSKVQAWLAKTIKSAQGTADTYW